MMTDQQMTVHVYAEHATMAGRLAPEAKGDDTHEHTGTPPELLEIAALMNRNARGGGGGQYDRRAARTLASEALDEIAAERFESAEAAIEAMQGVGLVVATEDGEDCFVGWPGEMPDSADHLASIDKHFGEWRIDKSDALY